jgi:hypothetical protein
MADSLIPGILSTPGLATGINSPSQKTDSPQKTKDAAAQFESLLVGQILKSAHEEEGGWLGSGEDQTAASAMQMADEYLSGDVVDKLAMARKFAETDSSLARNVAALEAAIPAPLPPSEITMTLGMPWIPATVINEFAKDHLGISNDIYVRHSDVLGGWTVGSDSQGPDFARWSTEDMNATGILKEALNKTRPRIYK